MQTVPHQTVFAENLTELDPTALSIRCPASQPLNLFIGSEGETPGDADVSYITRMLPYMICDKNSRDMLKFVSGSHTCPTGTSWQACWIRFGPCT